MDNKSEQAPGDTEQSVRKPDGELVANGERQVIEHVKQDLLQSGVRKEQAQIVATRVVQSVESYHSGPLPAAHEFAGYEQICPGSARDIVNMAMRDQAHEHHMDRWRLYGEFFLKVLAIIAALVIIAMMIGGAIYAADSGHEKLGIAIASGAGLSLVVSVIARIMLSRESPPQKPKTPQKAPQKRKR